MSLFSKRMYRAFKTILVSPQAEILALIIRIISILLLLYLDTLTDLGTNVQYTIISQDEQIQSLNAFNEKLINSDYLNLGYPNASLHTMKDYFWDLFVEPSSFESLLSGFRLVQYSVYIPAECAYDVDQLSNDISEQQGFIQNLRNCNPYNSEALANLQPSLFICKSTKLCLISLDCEEFSRGDIYKNTYQGLLKRYAKNQIQTKGFGTYPNQAFVADIMFATREEMELKLTQLIENNWVTNNTVALIIQFNRINKQSNAVYQNIFIKEFYVSSNQGFQYVINQISTNAVNSSTWYTFSIILLIFNFFFVMKIVFEGSIDPKPTQLLVFFVCLIEMTFAILCTVETAVLNSDIQEAIDVHNCTDSKIINWNSGFPILAPCHSYLMLDATYQIQQIRLIFLSCAVLFLPFQFFWLFSYIKGTELIVKFVNLIYRTTIHFFKLFLIRTATYLSWCLAFYIAFRKNFAIYNSYANSLYCMFIWSIPTEESQWERDALNTGQITNALLVCMFIFCRIYFVLMLLSFIAISIQSASDFEFDIRTPSSLQNLENINQNLKKLDKFQKNYLSDNEQNKLENGKLVAWLCQNVLPSEQIYQIDQECFQVIYSIIQKQVKLQQFQNISDMSQFVNFLFQIKPQLLFKSQVYFRIVLDLENTDTIQNVQSVFIKNDEKQKEYVNLARFFQQLKDKGSRVPLLLNYNSSTRPSDNIIITFFKIYPYIHLNNGKYEIFKEFILNKDVRQWQKRVYIAEDDNQDFDEEESDANQIN